MKTLCFYFQVHQPFRFKRYRFFDIGSDHYYYDDYSNESITNKVAALSYLPANKLLLKMLKKYEGQFKVTFSISGLAIEQFKLYAPEVLDSFRALADTGMVEFLAETYSHSLVALKDEEEFRNQVKAHSDLMESTFGVRPKVFRNTELIYSDKIGKMVADMGYQTILAEGASQVLGWHSPDFVYHNAVNPMLNVLVRNYKLSDDIGFRFGDQQWHEWPLTARKYVKWIREMDQSDAINIFLDYETFGEHQNEESGIFDFLKKLPAEVLKHQGMSFATPSEVVAQFPPRYPLNVPQPISWADEERDLSAWLGNEMQQEAFEKLYALLPRVRQCGDRKMLKDWQYLQCSDHFYYMCTKFFSDGSVHAYFSPYKSPYEAFINYMNILNDFCVRLDTVVPAIDPAKSFGNLIGILSDGELEMKKVEKEVKRLRKMFFAPAEVNGKEIKEKAVAWNYNMQ